MYVLFGTQDADQVMLKIHQVRLGVSRLIFSGEIRRCPLLQMRTPYNHGQVVRTQKSLKGQLLSPWLYSTISGLEMIECFSIYRINMIYLL